jgi:hypothetical protein
MHFDTQIVPKSTHDLLNLLRKLTGWSKNQCLALNQSIIKLLQNSRTERSCFPRSRLSLLNHIKPLAEGNNPPLLNG